MISFGIIFTKAAIEKPAVGNDAAIWQTPANIDPRNTQPQVSVAQSGMRSQLGFNLNNSGHTAPIALAYDIN
jgi:hypothetical protein